MTKRIVKTWLLFPRFCSWSTGSIGPPPPIFTPSPLSIPDRKSSSRFRRKHPLLRRPPRAASMDHGENAGYKEERCEGGKNQPTDHRAAKRRVLFAAFAEARGHRHHSNDHRQPGHQHGPDTHKTSFDGGIAGALALVQLLAREGNHQDTGRRGHAPAHERTGHRREG